MTGKQMLAGAMVCAVVVLGGCAGQPEARWPVEVRHWVKTQISLPDLYFNSRDTNCKAPFGAVEEGETVTLTFSCKKGDIQAINVELTKQTIEGNSIKESYAHYRTIPMKRLRSDEKHDYWQCSFSIPRHGVYGYHFGLAKSMADGIVYADNWNMVKVPWVKVRGTGGFGKVTRITPGAYKLPYTLTVYKKGWTLPKWTENMVIYYIFPERFKNGNRANDQQVGKTKFYGNKGVEFHKNWTDPNPWAPGPDGEWCNDFYGGDLDGVIAKLDYILSLGVNVIYLNPIFKAPSNHKYDTADYMQVDPHFGTLATFKKLVAEAKKRGIRILLDASLNHCGSDSVYMDRYAKYPSYGAFEGEKIRKDSPYYSWFELKPGETDPNKRYEQWANPTLANLAESKGWMDFAFRNRDSVTKYWIQQGAGGWRMDVTPWVSDGFWREWRTHLKREFPESFTVAEVWFDASKYLTGDMFDSTMNYILRQALPDFFAKGQDARKSVEALEMVRENYPPHVFRRLMNLLSSHDQPRILHELGYVRYGQPGYAVYRKRVQAVTAFQFAYPGAPTIYYGDEIGLTGGHDPGCRGPYPWKEDGGGSYGDWSLLPFFRKLAALRRGSDLLAKGRVRMLPGGKNTIAFERALGKKRLLALFSNSPEGQDVVLAGIAAGRYRDILSGKTVVLKAGDTRALPGWGFALLLKE